mmetsp:Transcript_87302/g.199327  ORF Transcript_87302/g.199327 Transcript_87302/m.199327 type:complete len:105 (+) Transcript_87302:502-816(+)
MASIRDYVFHTGLNEQWEDINLRLRAIADRPDASKVTVWNPSQDRDLAMQHAIMYTGATPDLLTDMVPGGPPPPGYLFAARVIVQLADPPNFCAPKSVVIEGSL